jgi:hypothetical protein
MSATTVIVAVIAVLSAVPAGTAQMTAADTQLDPAVVAYNAVIKRIDLNIPLDRRLVAGLIDQLASALEGVAIGKGITDEEFFAGIRRGRGTLRSFANTPLGTDGRQETGHQLFTHAAQLFKELERKLGSNPSIKASVDAVERAARSLEMEEPLRWQPDNVENFLVLGGEALKHLSATAAVR